MTQTAVVKGGDTLGECCIWDAETGVVWWVDILAPTLQSFEPNTRTHRVYPLPAKNCGCIALRRSGGLVVALDSGLHGFDPRSGRLEFLVDVEPDVPSNRYNDGRCDRRGRLWIGTMDTEIRKSSGSFYRIGPDLEVRRVLDGLTIPNSTAFSPDDRTLYFADTAQHTIWAFDFDIDEGMVTNRRVFADLRTEGRNPDGSCVDAEGFLWNCEYGGARITRYALDGRVDRVVGVPVTNPTCCCFGGKNLDTLYVTSAAEPFSMEERRARPLEGALLAIQVGVRGLPEAKFGG